MAGSGGCFAENAPQPPLPAIFSRRNKNFGFVPGNGKNLVRWNEKAGFVPRTANNPVCGNKYFGFVPELPTILSGGTNTSILFRSREKPSLLERKGRFCSQDCQQSCLREQKLRFCSGTGKNLVCWNEKADFVPENGRGQILRMGERKKGKSRKKEEKREGRRRKRGKKKEKKEEREEEEKRGRVVRG